VVNSNGDREGFVGTRVTPVGFRDSVETICFGTLSRIWSPRRHMSNNIDPATESTRLEAVEQYLGYLRESTPYYSWLDPEIETVERGFV
jgi:hypothetical protein